MSRTELRRWLLLGVAAFALRAGLAVLTERAPLFPAYYYHDASYAERIAADMADAWNRGERLRNPSSPGQRAHAALMALTYCAVGRRPLANKLLNSLLGALSVVLFGVAMSALVGGNAGSAAAVAMAAWPSHAFYTSQNFKESVMFALVFGSFAALAPLISGAPAARPGFRAAAAAACLIAAGFLRAYLLPVLCVSCAAAGAWALLRRRKAARWAIAGVAAAILLYKPASHLLFTVLLPNRTGTAVAESGFVPEAVDPEGARSHPLSPRGISRFRLLRQAADQEYALKTRGSPVETQIFPGARFRSWGEVALFFPSAAFMVLYMPLPGLYPIDGRLGRALAAAENVLLLLVSVAALAGLARRRLGPGEALPLLFFALMLAGSAPLEFDLGSASRHKLLYLPMLFPFAAAWLTERRA